MRYKIGILECSRPEHEIDVFGMEYVIKKALYLRWTENVRVCIYKGIEVPLTLTPYEVLWKLAENVYKSHIVCPIDKEMIKKAELQLSMKGMLFMKFVKLSGKQALKRT